MSTSVWPRRSAPTANPACSTDRGWLMAPRLGVFGGSGFYEFLDGAAERVVDTPYGPPAAPIVVGSIGGHDVAFMARHGVGHDFQPHRVPYRANVWAMHSVGVTSLIAPCSVG